MYITVFSSGQCCRLLGPQEKTSLCTWTVTSLLGLCPAIMLPGQPDFQGLREGWGPSEFSGHSLAHLPTPQDKGDRRCREGTKRCSPVLHERRDGARRTWQKQVRMRLEPQLCAQAVGTIFGDHLRARWESGIVKGKGPSGAARPRKRPFPPPSSLDPHAAPPAPSVQSASLSSHPPAHVRRLQGEMDLGVAGLVWGGSPSCLQEVVSADRSVFCQY